MDSDRDSVLESEDGKEVTVRWSKFSAVFFIFRLFKWEKNISFFLFNSNRMRIWIKRKKSVTII